MIDLDATLVGAHSEKEGAAPNYKHGFGFPPLMAFLDATGEPLAARLRPGNAAPGNAEDHVIVLDEALAQLPIDPTTCEVIARTDAAGCSPPASPRPAAQRNVRFIIGHKLSAELAAVVTQMPKKCWQRAISADGTDERDSGEVAEITDLVDLSPWSQGTRVIARRELPHPGAQLTFSDVKGYRYQVFITDHEEADVCFLEGLYRGRGRCERRICDAKDTGLANLPSANFAINAAWLALVLIAGDLLVWMKGLCLESELTRAEPKRLRYTLLHTTGVLVHSARRTTLRIAQGWPWADDLVVAFIRLPELVQTRELIRIPGPLIRHTRGRTRSLAGSASTRERVHRPMSPNPRRHRSANNLIRRDGACNGHNHPHLRTTERSGLGVRFGHLLQLGKRRLNARLSIRL